MHITLKHLLFAQKGYKQVVELFINHGANEVINAVMGCSESTALMHASNHPEIVKILIQNKADIKLKDKYNKTALINFIEDFLKQRIPFQLEMEPWRISHDLFYVKQEDRLNAIKNSIFILVNEYTGNSIEFERLEFVLEILYKIQYIPPRKSKWEAGAICETDEEFLEVLSMEKDLIEDYLRKRIEEMEDFRIELMPNFLEYAIGENDYQQSLNKEFEYFFKIQKTSKI